MVCFSMSERTEALLSASMSDMEAQVKAKEGGGGRGRHPGTQDFDRQYNTTVRGRGRLG
jgi:hypothetical protein